MRTIEGFLGVDFTRIERHPAEGDMLNVHRISDNVEEGLTRKEKRMTWCQTQDYGEHKIDNSREESRGQIVHESHNNTIFCCLKTRLWFKRKLQN